MRLSSALCLRDRDALAADGDESLADAAGVILPGE